VGVKVKLKAIVELDKPRPSTEIMGRENEYLFHDT